VGTILGERLLYLPSVGACLALALGLAPAATLLGEALERFRPRSATGTSMAPHMGNPSTGASHGKANGSLAVGGVSNFGAAAARAQGKHLLLLAAAAYLGVLGTRTRARLRDWSDESQLFESALRVCPRSLKVLSNRALTLLDKEPRDPKLTLSLAWFENETKERRNILQMNENVCVCLLCERNV